MVYPHRLQWFPILWEYFILNEELYFAVLVNILRHTETRGIKFLMFSQVKTKEHQLWNSKWGMNVCSKDQKQVFLEWWCNKHWLECLAILATISTFHSYIPLKSMPMNFAGFYLEKKCKFFQVVPENVQHIHISLLKICLKHFGIKLVDIKLTITWITFECIDLTLHHLYTWGLTHGKTDVTKGSRSGPTVYSMQLVWIAHSVSWKV